MRARLKGCALRYQYYHPFRLKKLINSSKCVLFMKGDRDVPKCGFSRQTIELLNSLDAEYATFDIFSDEEVRQGLKTYSNWPTYPQLYIDGELIGRQSNFVFDKGAF